jgi:hypothetical protein
MVKFILALAFLLTIAAVETASAAPSFCTFENGVPIVDFDPDFDGPA